jgi:hypothetical protein
MTFTLQFESVEIVSDEMLNRIKSQCQLQMARAFKVTAKNNLGEPPGEDRPEQWKDLSDSPTGLAYQKKVGRSIATLYETGALSRSIVVDESAQPESASVVCLSDYGADLHFGETSNHLPERPFFPMVGDDLTPYTEVRCMEAAEDWLRDNLT